MNDYIFFPYYSGNIKFTKSLGLTSLSSFIKGHKYPISKNKAIIDKIKECNDPKEKRKLKHKLYSFTPSCIIKKGVKRKYSNIDRYTGLMQIDLDDIDDLHLAIELKHWLFLQPECVVSYLSPSNNVKGLIRTHIPRTKDQYKRIFNAVEQKYEETGYFDTATKNAVLPLFLSYDEDIKFRDFSEAHEWNKELEIEIKYVQLNDNPNFNLNDNSKSYYCNKTIRILTNKIKNIVDCGHPQVRNASLILGSRVGAGYITKDEAESVICSLIRCNSYLSKGIDGYIDTALWGISEGSKNPKYY